MVSIKDQITSQRLVCPQSHQPLIWDETLLRTADGAYQYPMLNGVPILLHADQQQQYLQEQDSVMAEEYDQAPPTSRIRQLIDRIIAKDYRSKASRDAFAAVIDRQPDDALCVSVGGGPVHVHPKMVNLNIAPFANVHVVGDGYQLPYADGTVDAVFCEAVLEHLELPEQAVQEMFRVLRPGGQAFAATPFLQKFHAYPNHFQNFTLIGQRRLFERAGFETVSAGTCVGPTYAVFSLLTSYLFTYVKIPIVREIVGGMAAIVALSLRPLDLWLNRHFDSHLYASTTYVHAVKR